MKRADRDRKLSELRTERRKAVTARDMATSKENTVLIHLHVNTIRELDRKIKAISKSKTKR